MERPLLQLAIALTQERLRQADTPATQAQHLNNLSVDLAESGDKPGGLAASRRAVAIREQLAQENFAVYGPALASSLNNLSNLLAGSGDEPGDLAAIHRAVKIVEPLAQENFAVYGPVLASSLNHLSNRLAESGEHPEAATTQTKLAALKQRLLDEQVHIPAQYAGLFD